MNLKEVLNEEQIQPVNQIDGPVLVLAGAGSGKTRVLSYRIAHMILDKGIDARNILAITFTNKAAKTMKERVNNLTNNSNVTISTFHSFCAMKLRQYINFIVNYKNNFSIYDDDDSKKAFISAFKKIFSDYDDTDKETKKKMKQIALSFRDEIDNAKNMGLTPDEYAVYLKEGHVYTNSTIESVIKVYNEYNKILVSNNAMDFNDLLFNFYLLLKDNKFVLNEMNNLYRYILIDEFQDTNTIQNKIATLLAGEDKNIFVVGDDDQSIYSWRGADISNILDFEKTFPNAKVFKLERNYRSTEQILNAANEVIKNNIKRKDKTLYTKRQDGVRVEVKQALSDRDEVEYIASQITSIMSLGKYKYSDFCILVRNNYLSQKFEQEFARRRFPYVIYGGFKFFNRVEIKMVIAILKCLLNPYDNEGFIRVISAYNGIGSVTLKRLQDFAAQKYTPMMHALDDIDDAGFSPSTYNKLNDFRTYIYNIRDSYEKDKDAFLCDFLNITKISDLLNYENNIDKDNKIDNIVEFINNLNQEVKSGRETIDSYLVKISLVSDADTEGDDSQIVISTIHSIKGLEFKCVFVACLEDDILPHKRSHDGEDDLEEERRLMYVAITRAIDRLYLTYSRTRFNYYADSVQKLPSRFLCETGLITRKSPFEKFKDTCDEPLHNDEYYNRQDSYDSTVMDAFRKQDNNKNNKRIEGLRVGCKVEHDTFGEGVIETLNGNIAKIAFSNGQSRVFSLNHTPLKVIK